MRHLLFFLRELRPRRIIKLFGNTRWQFFLLLLFFCVLTSYIVYAADGSGTATISPTTAVLSATGTTFVITYTAAENMNDGDVVVTVPDGWSAPQGTAGTAGYTTATTSGLFGVVEDDLDALGDWEDKSVLIGTTNSTSDPKEGSGNLQASVAVGLGTSEVYKNISSADWSGYSHVGFWLKTSRVLALGDLDFWISESSDVPNNGTTVKYDIPEILPINTWVHIVLDLTGEDADTRDAVLSYGFNMPINVLATYSFDNIALGTDELVAFDGQSIELQLLELDSSEEITIVYGSGGGTSGVTIPDTSGTHTFNTTARVDAGGTLTALASSPSVTVPDSVVPSVTLTSPQSGEATSSVLALTASANDNAGVAGVQFYIDGTTIGSEDTSAPYGTTYDTTATTSGSHTAFAVVRDDSDNYATSTVVTFSIDNATPTVSSLSPADDGTDVAVDANLAITFNEAVATSSGNLTIFDASDDSQVEVIAMNSSKVSASTSAILVFNPDTTFATNTTYYVQIDAGAIIDDVGNEFSGVTATTTWNFTTTEGEEDGGGEEEEEEEEESGGGGGGGGSSRNRCSYNYDPNPDITRDGIVGIFDFNQLMVAWDVRDEHDADIDQDCVVGIFDFNQLMVGWS